MTNKYQIMGGILLVSGTTIGAGMLALPVVTGVAGFFPSVILLICYWAYMTFTAFLILEVNLWMGPHTNLITMAKKTLGKTASHVSWIIYLFLLYTLTTAYIAGSGPIFLMFIQFLTGIVLPQWVGPLPLLIIFGFFVYKGIRSVDYVNRLLMLGLVFTYLLMISFLTPYIKPVLLTHLNWPAIVVGVSIVSTSFGFHIIIPTLTDYLERDIKKLRIVLLVGSIIPLIVYISWELLTLGNIPLQGKDGLLAGYQQGIDGATLLSHFLDQSKLSILANLFSLFAIVTSFLGVSLSLFDCLADGLRIHKTRRGRLILYLLAFLPPLCLTLTDPHAFLHALEYAGAFGVMTLLGLLPILMVWSGRYIQHRQAPFKVPGGKSILILTLIISLSVIALEIAIKSGYLNQSFFMSKQVSQS